MPGKVRRFSAGAPVPGCVSSGPGKASRVAFAPGCFLKHRPGRRCRGYRASSSSFPAQVLQEITRSSGGTTCSLGIWAASRDAGAARSTLQPRQESCRVPVQPPFLGGRPGVHVSCTASVLWQMDPETARLVRCLQQIHKVIGKGSEILASTSQPSVCREVLLSAPGTAYILGLSEVYRVSRRLEERMKARKLASELLQHTLREVDMAWNNVLSFLVLGQSAFPLLTLQGWEPSAGSAGCPSVPGPAPSQACGVCLMEVKQQPEAHAGNSDPVMHQGSYYHAGCANFWLNCVDSILPRET